jgi:hypothetical protein
MGYKSLSALGLSYLLFFGFNVYAQSVSIDVTLNPAGNFKIETKQVTGTAYKTGDGFAAENILVDIRNLQTGVSLRDKHTRKHLGVPKYNSVKLIKATGKDGTGEALIEVMDKQQKVNGTYKVNGAMLEAEFPMVLSGVGIKDVAYMGIGVEDTVTVHVSVPIKETAAPAKAGPAPSKTTKKTSAQSKTKIRTVASAAATKAAKAKAAKKAKTRKQ